MINFSANLSMMFNEVNFFERFDLAKEYNFTGVEYLFPYEYQVERIQSALEKNDLKQILFDLPAGDWDSGDRGIAVQPNRVGEFQDSVEVAIEYAKALNCKRITCLAGIPDINVSAEISRKTLVENLKFATDSLINTDITLLLEPINSIDIKGFYLNRTLQALKIISDVGAKNLKLQFDIYHMQIMEGNLINTIGENLDDIYHFQIADNPGRNEPGTGEINFNNVLNFIDTSSYVGWIGCEYNPKGSTIEGLKWIECYRNNA